MKITKTDSKEYGVIDSYGMLLLYLDLFKSPGKTKPIVTVGKILDLSSSTEDVIDYLEEAQRGGKIKIEKPESGSNELAEYRIKILK